MSVYVSECVSGCDRVRVSEWGEGVCWGVCVHCRFGTPIFLRNLVKLFLKKFYDTDRITVVNS